MLGQRHKRRRLMEKSEAAREGETLIVALPGELILEIMRRMPAKCVLQLRCVCKSWKSLVSEAHLMKVSIERALFDIHACTSRAIKGLKAISFMLLSVVDYRDLTVALFQSIMATFEIVGAELQQIKRGIRLYKIFLKIQNSR